MSRQALWWAASIFIHRWLGIAGGILFIAWFASGIAMMYVRMPELSHEERLLRAPPLDVSAVRLSLVEAAARAGLKPSSAAQVSMLAGRPVYRFPGRPTTTVFADEGELFSGLTRETALSLARAFVPERASELAYDGVLTLPDQWTLQSRAHFPLHRIALGDDADTRLYFSNVTGEPVMKTTRRERFWANVGPVTHWLYWPFLRSNGPLWTQVIIWTSIVGCVLCVLGLLVGVVRYSPSARFRMQGAASRSPYAGLLKWHHYAGLIFGVMTLTWTFSGLLSMGPFAMLSSGELTREQREAVSGGPVDLTTVTVPALNGAVSAIRESFAPRELSLLVFRGEPYWRAEQAPQIDRPNQWTSTDQSPRSPLAARLISASNPAAGTFERFSDQVIMDVARAIIPDAAIRESDWLSDYDAYYYDRRRERALPVLRVRYGDPEDTWLYLDPQRGSIAMLSRPRGRANRWLYHGLHSFDLPAFYNSRPAWDISLIALSIGGIALAVTTLMPGWQRVGRHISRFRSKRSRS